MYFIKSFYKFVRLYELKKTRITIESNLKKYDINGSIILSPEGINAAISSKKENLKKFNNFLKKYLKIKSYNSENLSTSSFNPFHKPKVKIKNEVVPMGFKIKNYKKPKNNLNPHQWNKIINKKDTILIDARKPLNSMLVVLKNH